MIDIARTAFRTALCATVVLLSSTCPHRGADAAPLNTKRYAGNGCVTSSNSAPIDRSAGLLNPSTTEQIFAVCPIIRENVLRDSVGVKVYGQS
jgi:hypothetical protein